MGYREAGLIVKTSLHDHGGDCDDISDAKWSEFYAVVEAAVAEHLSGRYTPGAWIDHHRCLCAGCEEE